MQTSFLESKGLFVSGKFIKSRFQARIKNQENE